jgi:hypothetical protein
MFLGLDQFSLGSGSNGSCTLIHDPYETHLSLVVLIIKEQYLNNKPQFLLIGLFI